MKKRITSLILVLTLLLSIGTFNFGVRAEETAEKAADDYNVSLLKSLGILDSSVTGDTEVTRGSGLEIILKLANSDISYDGTTQYYTDVPTTSPYADDVYVATLLGMISGMDNGTFEPDSPMSATNAVKLLVCVMGYGREAEAAGGYPKGYSQVASKLKMKIAGGDTMTVSDLSAMIYSLLEVQTVDLSGIGSTIKYTEKGTLLEQMDMQKYEGILCANANTNIYGKSTAGKGKIYIGDDLISVSNDCEDMLGCKVVAYATVDEYDVATLIYIETKDTDVVTAKYNEIDNASSVITDNKLKISKDDSSRSKTYKLNKDACILYNGYISDVYANTLFDLATGSVTIVDNDEDGYYDVIRITTSDDSVFSAYSSASEVITLKNNTSIDISDNNQLTGFTITKDGAEIAPENLGEWNVVSAYYDRPAGYDNRKLAKIVVSSKSISGTVDSKSSDTIVIDDTKYGLSKNFISGGDLISAEIGKSATFFLNENGDVFAARADMLDSISKKTGIVVSMTNDTNLEEVYIKVYDYTDEMKIYQLADKVKLDGSKEKKEDCYDVMVPRGTVTRQLIIYELNNDGKVSYIDTATKGDKEDSNTLRRIHTIAEDAMRYRSGLKSFDGKFNLDAAGTKMFSQPKAVDEDDSYKSDLTPSSLTDDGFYNADVYVTDNPFCAYAVVLNEAGASNVKEGAMHLVTKVYQTLYKDDPYYCISTLSQETTTEYYIEEAVFEKAGVEQGDVVAFATKNINEVTEMLKIYDLSEDEFMLDSNPYGIFSANQRVMYFSPYQKKGTWVSLSYDDPSTVGEDDVLESRNVDSYRKYVYDTTTKTGRAATAADILDYKTGGGKCSKILMSETSAWPKMCIIYN